MSHYWFLENTMQRLMDFLRQDVGGCTQEQEQSAEIDIADVMVFMFAVIFMCASTWGPMRSSKPGRGGSPKPRRPVLN